MSGKMQSRQYPVSLRCSLENILLGQIIRDNNMTDQNVVWTIPFLSRCMYNIMTGQDAAWIISYQVLE